MELVHHLGVVWSIRSLLGQKRDHVGSERCSQVPTVEFWVFLINIDKDVYVLIPVGAMLLSH